MPQTQAADALHAMKYRSPGEDFRESMNRVAFGLKDSDNHYHQFREVIIDQRFLNGGRIQSSIGSSKHVTAHNCYVSGTIQDSFVDGPGSIMDRAKEAAATMRMGGGIGYDFSTLRPRGELIAKLQSQSSGPVSFMHIFDAVCLATSSSGHRRGAEMGILRIDHPDIEEFIHAKNNRDKLIGFNISVAVTDEFMECVAAGKEFALRWGNKTYRYVDAVQLWENLMRSTWDWAEPGVVFIDTINRMNNLYYCETIAATNPCFTGDTKVWTAYGPKTFLELANGKYPSIPVLTQLANGYLAYRDMVNPRLTRKDQKLVTVTLRGSGAKNNSITKFRCTPDHKIFLTNGTVKFAKDLTHDDSIYSVYRHKANQKGYMQLAGFHEEALEHHVAVEYQEGRRPIYPHEHAHHIDEDNSNNIPSNLEILSAQSHNSLNMIEKNRLGLMAHNNHRAMPGEENGRWRDDIETTYLQQLRNSGLSYIAIARKVGCSKYTVMKRLGWERNHTVVSVITNVISEDVYCGTVESTGRFFILTGENEGVLVSNCSEQPLPPFGACLLGSFNLVKYLRRQPVPVGTNPWSLDMDQLIADIPPVVRATDNVIEKSRYPLAEQRAEAITKRRMGLGITGLANTAEAMGYVYGSPEFCTLEAGILSTINNEAYKASAYLAKEKGPFPLYDQERYLAGEFIKTLPEETRELIRKYGIRNSHLTSIAPTGTISLCADNVSSSIEPVFAYRQERAINTPTGSSIEVLEDYGVKFLNHHGKLAKDVTADEHVRVLLTAQKYLDSAASKTVNMDGKKMPWNDFVKLYETVWSSGGKGCSTYNISGKRGALLVELEDEVPEPTLIDYDSCELDPVSGRRSCE